MNLRLAVGVLALTTLAAVPAFAQEEPEPDEASVPRLNITLDPSSQPEGWEDVPELVIAGHVVIRLRSVPGGPSARERAENLRRRLGPILTLPGLSGSDVSVQSGRSGASVFVRNRLLITVDRGLAQASGTTPEKLAALWAKNLRGALPQVNVSVRMSLDPFPVAPVKKADNR